MPLARPADYEAWAKDKQKAWDSYDTNPNSFYYRHKPPGEAVARGPWSAQEKSAFISLLTGKYGGDTSAIRWGDFARSFPGRVGYTCRNYLHKLDQAGELPPGVSVKAVTRKRKGANDSGELRDDLSDTASAAAVAASGESGPVSATLAAPAKRQRLVKPNVSPKLTDASKARPPVTDLSAGAGPPGDGRLASGGGLRPGQRMVDIQAMFPGVRQGAIDFRCDRCDAGCVDYRWRCDDCFGFDLCEGCHAQQGEPLGTHLPSHRMSRVPLLGAFPSRGDLARTELMKAWFQVKSPARSLDCRPEQPPILTVDGIAPSKDVRSDLFSAANMTRKDLLARCALCGLHKGLSSAPKPDLLNILLASLTALSGSQSLDEHDRWFSRLRKGGSRDENYYYAQLRHYGIACNKSEGVRALRYKLERACLEGLTESLSPQHRQILEELKPLEWQQFKDRCMGPQVMKLGRQFSLRPLQFLEKWLEEVEGDRRAVVTAMLPGPFDLEYCGMGDELKERGIAWRVVIDPRGGLLVMSRDRTSLASAVAAGKKDAAETLKRLHKEEKARHKEEKARQLEAERELKRQRLAAERRLRDSHTPWDVRGEWDLNCEDLENELGSYSGVGDYSMTIVGDGAGSLMATFELAGMDDGVIRFDAVDVTKADASPSLTYVYRESGEGEMRFGSYLTGQFTFTERGRRMEGVLHGTV